MHLLLASPAACPLVPLAWGNVRSDASAYRTSLVSIWNILGAQGKKEGFPPLPQMPEGDNTFYSTIVNKRLKCLRSDKLQLLHIAAYGTMKTH